MVNRLLLVVLTLVLLVNKTMADTCDAYFPNVVQGHATGSAINFADQAFITTKSKDYFDLDFSSSTGNGNVNRCSNNGNNANKKCTITGNNAPAITLPGFESTNKGTNYQYGAINYNEIATISVSDMQTLDIQGGATVTFPTINTHYKINTATFSAQSKVTLETGTYWFNNLTISDDVTVNINGKVTILVNGTLTIQKQAKVNSTSGSAKNLTIFSWSDVDLKETSEISAVLYAQDVDMMNQAKLFGAISVANQVSLIEQSQIQYEDVSDADCDIPAILGTPIFSPSDGIRGGQLENNSTFLIGESGYRLGENNWPSNEGPEHLIDGVGQKYLNFGEFNTGAIIKPAIGCSILDSIKFWTANDAVPRDPASYELYGTNSIINDIDDSHALSLFTLISEGNLTLPNTRNANANSALDDNNAQIISFTNTRKYASYLLIFPSVKNQNNANSMQIAEVQAFGAVEACYLPPNLEYRFDEPSWNGSPNEVLDNSQTLLNGSAVADATTITDGQVCRAATLDGRDDYININGIDSYLNTTASLSFWMKSTQRGNDTAWNAPGIAGIEERGGGDDIFWGYLDASGHIRMKKGNGNSAQSNTIVSNGAWHHVVLTWDSFSGEVEVYVNGNLEGRAVSAMGDVSNAFSDIGRIRNSFSATNFEGQLDELIVFDSVISESYVNTIYTNQLNGNNYDGSPRNCPVETIDHYEIIHDGSGLTCNAESVTIKACTDSECTNLSSESISLDLQATSASSGLETKSSLSFDEGFATVSFNHFTSETINLSIANENIDASNATICSGSTAASCDISFADSGFIFNVPTQTACAISNNITISAVRKDVTSQQCVPSFSSVDKTLKFWNTYDSPTSGTKQATLKQNSIDYLLPNTEGASIPISFDANGQAIFQITYPDAGQLTLKASHDDSASSSDSDLRMEGSFQFVSVPAKLVVATTDSNAACTSNDANCSAFKAAGEEFNLNVNATCADGTVTPNFQMNDITLSVNDIAPNIGNPVSLAINNIDISDADNGSHNESAQTISEVGVFSITATPSNLYFTETISPATSASIGRFTPDYYQLGAVDNGVLSAVNSFVYTGQMQSTTSTIGKISYLTQPEFTITAKSVNDSTTLNYTGSFIKLLETGIVRETPTQDATQLGKDVTNKVDLSAILNTPNFAEYSPGVLKYQFNSSDHYVYTRNANSLIAPFTTAIDLQINSVIDSDNIEATDLDIDTSNGVLTLQPVGLEIRFGRWIMENSYGPETSDIRIPMFTQYWNGSYFVNNDADSFTSFTATATDTNIIVNHLSPTATPNIVGSGLFISGENSNLIVESPGANVRGSVTVEHKVPSWLKYDWSVIDESYDENPSAIATFGLYRGNDRIIYRQELFD